MPICSRCGGPTAALFYSVACVRCDAPIHYGWIVHKNAPAGTPHVVFETREWAQQYQSGLVIPCASAQPFRWRGGCAWDTHRLYMTRDEALRAPASPHGAIWIDNIDVTKAA